MNKTLFTVLLCGLTTIAYSQSASVEKSTFGIQTGYFGVYLHNETKLSDQVAFRSELGLEGGLFGGSLNGGTGFVLAPVVTLEPRWYYNLNSRVSQLKKIAGNSGNFVTLKISYNPNWFVISNSDRVSIPNQVVFIPTWGIKRNIGDHFTYELGIGLGYRYYRISSFNFGEEAINLHLRIGYRF